MLHHINILEPIAEESIVRKINDYRERWLKESVQVRKDVDHLQSDVECIKYEDIPKLEDTMKDIKASKH